MQQLSSQDAEKIEQIIQLWFGNSTGVSNKSWYFDNLWNTLWFGGLNDNSIDNMIREKYQSDVELALLGSYNHWKQTANGSLALIILLDQFTRNIYRNTPKSFAGDPQAVACCLEGLEHSYDEQLAPVYRLFFYLPLLHAEDLELQNRSVELFTLLSKENSKRVPVIFERFEKLAMEKRQNIVQFGRFPKRNKILGRQSTIDEEKEYAISANY